MIKFYDRTFGDKLGNIERKSSIVSELEHSLLIVMVIGLNEFFDKLLLM